LRPFTCFAGLNPLSPPIAVVAQRAPDTLAIHNADAWFSLSPSFVPYIAAEERVDVLPCAVIAPSSVVVPDVIPDRKIARQHPPLTAGSGALEDGIQDFTDIDNAFLATPGLLCN
jgi:hypothetical protein